MLNSEFRTFYTGLLFVCQKVDYFRTMSCVPIIKRSDLSVYLMEIDANQLHTYLTGLTSQENERFHTFTHPEKKLEFAASRFLRTELFGKQQIHYNEVGSPFIDNEGFISLSHTRGLVGLAHSPDFNVGLDVECVREKAMLLHPKFIHTSEYAFFDTKSPLDMSLLWSFKETLFKLADRKGVHFSRDLVIHRENGQLYGTIDQYHILHRYPLEWNEFGQYLITCNTGTAQIIPR